MFFRKRKGGKPQVERDKDAAVTSPAEARAAGAPYVVEHNDGDVFMVYPSHDPEQLESNSIHDDCIRDVRHVSVSTSKPSQIDTTVACQPYASHPA